jgi:hypothetical protein
MVLLLHHYSICGMYPRNDIWLELLTSQGQQHYGLTNEEEKNAHVNDTFRVHIFNEYKSHYLKVTTYQQQVYLKFVDLLYVF